MADDEHYQDERHRAFVALMERVLKLERQVATYQRNTQNAMVRLIKLFEAYFNDESGDGGALAQGLDRGEVPDRQADARDGAGPGPSG